MVELRDYPKPNPKPLNGAQFSQGTLFQQPKPSAEHRWPAGYTPERKEAVGRAIPTKNVSVSSKFYKGEVYKPTRDFGYVSTPKSIRTSMKPQREQTRNAIVDILARSTAPIEDITRNTPKFKVAPITAQGRMHAKLDWARGEPIQGQISLNPYTGARQHAEHTVLHELGHHVDFEADPRGFIRTANTEMVRGRASPSLEGAAEGYAAKHTVPRRNEEALPYHKRAAYKEMQFVPSFQYHFERVSGQTPAEAMARPKPHMGEQFHQSNLFSRDADPALVTHPAYRDYGQHPLRTDWDLSRGEVGSITVGGGAEAALGLTGRRKMQRGVSYEVPKPDQERIGKLWNDRRPHDRLRGT